ncbi:MAG: DUF1071 domain-containing protein [Pseudomonadota bacterium]|jgi:hypothetical protein
MNQSIFHQLAAVDVGAHVEKKGKFSYLSWPFALSELQKVDPTATWEVMRFPLPDCPHLLTPVMLTPVGVFVEVAVTAGGKRLSQVHPVLDERNSAVKAPNAYEVNKAIMRCLVKAIALHGLGLNVYAGEDLPMNDDDDEPKAKSKPKAPAAPPPVAKPASSTATPAAKPAASAPAVKPAAAEKAPLADLTDEQHALAVKIADAADGDVLASLVDRIGDVTNRASVAFIFKSLVSQRASLLVDEKWVGTEQEQKAVAWIRGQMEARTKTTTAQAA